MPAEMPVSERPIRLDFDMQVLSMDEETRIATFVLRPNPDRYEDVVLDERLSRSS